MAASGSNSQQVDHDALGLAQIWQLAFFFSAMCFLVPCNKQLQNTTTWLNEDDWQLVNGSTRPWELLR